MANRQEFRKAVKVEIIQRATINGMIVCEGCGCFARRFEIHHIIADAMKIDKSKPLTAKDGKLLCKGSPESCHDVQTNSIDIPAIAKAKRIEAKHLGAMVSKAKIKSAGFAKSEKPKREGKKILPPRPMYGPDN